MKLAKKSAAKKRTISQGSYLTCGLSALLWICGLQAAYLAGFHAASTTNDNMQNNRDLISTSKSSKNIDNSTTTGSNQNGMSYELAYQQSYGFFDDITDEQWKLHQERARTAKDHRFKDPLKFWFHPGWWYINNYEPVFTCPNIRRVGGVGDGPKWTCDPHRILKVANDRKQKAIERGDPNAKNQSYCLIYSIGSAGKFEWEDGLMDILGTTCEIHIFDPGNYEKDWMAEKNVYFHRMGFKSSYDSGFKPVVRGNFVTFQEAIQQLGHTGRTIDILKVDCEFCEWFCYKDFLSTADVRQILVETHEVPHPQKDKTKDDKNTSWPYPPMKATDYFDAFKEHGFMLYSKEINGHPAAAGRGVEWGYIKLHPDFINK